MIWISDGWVGITVSSIETEYYVYVVGYQEMGYKIVQFGETKVIGVHFSTQMVISYGFHHLLMLRGIRFFDRQSKTFRSMNQNTVKLDTGQCAVHTKPKNDVKKGRPFYRVYQYLVLFINDLTESRQFISFSHNL